MLKPIGLTGVLRGWNGEPARLHVFSGQPWGWQKWARPATAAGKSPGSPGSSASRLERLPAQLSSALDQRPQLPWSSVRCQLHRQGGPKPQRAQRVEATEAAVGNWTSIPPEDGLRGPSAPACSARPPDTSHAALMSLFTARIRRTTGAGGVFSPLRVRRRKMPDWLGTFQAAEKLLFLVSVWICAHQSQIWKVREKKDGCRRAGVDAHGKPRPHSRHLEALPVTGDQGVPFLKSHLNDSAFPFS